MRITANGISINYQIRGKGTNLVLIHGAGDNLNMWYHQVPVFAKNYRVVTFDVRGSGKTDRPEGQYSIPLFAEDAYQLMKAIGVDRAYFLGYSMGGRIALELAIHHPDLVKGLVLANSSVGIAPPTPESLERRRVTLELLDNGNLQKVAEMMITSAFSPNFQSRNPTEFDKYMNVKLQNKPDGIARLMRSFSVPSVPPDLRRLKCPVLLIVGENDQYMGVEQGRQAHQAIPGSKLVILPTGHAAAIELPERFNSAVSGFLSSIEKS